MPYITPDHRARFTAWLNSRPYISSSEAGALNYVLTKIVFSIWTANPSYTTANAIVGVLDAVKLEFYRRVVAPYEDAKCAKNGDVYE